MEQNQCQFCGLNEGHLDTCAYAPSLQPLETDMLMAQAELEKAATASPEVAKNLCEYFLDTYYVHQAMKTKQGG